MNGSYRPPWDTPASNSVTRNYDGRGHVLTDGGTSTGVSDRFGFSDGDRVLVRVRENGNSGPTVAKFEAECEGIYVDGPGSGYARFDVPWGLMNSIRLRYYEAEFEVVA